MLVSWPGRQIQFWKYIPYWRVMSSLVQICQVVSEMKIPDDFLLNETQFAIQYRIVKMTQKI